MFNTFRAHSVCFILLVAFFCSAAQQPQVFAELLAKAEQSFAKNQYSESEEWAQRAVDVAQTIKNKEQEAQALYQRGLAQVKQNGLFTRGKAERSFRAASLVTKNRPLKIKIYQQLRVIATSRNDNLEVQQIDNNIMLLQRNIDLKLKEKSTKKRVQEQFEAVAEVNNQMADSLTNLQVEQQRMAEEQQRMEVEQRQMEEAIRTLTIEQIRSDLLFAQQRQRLDSLRVDSLVSQLDLQDKNAQLQQQDNALREQESELVVARSYRNFLIAIAGIIALILGGLLLRFKEVRKYNRQLEDKNEIIEAEKERANQLLLNILPAKVAEELKLNGTATARHYAEATVLFADFEGFSQIAKLRSPQELVADLDYCFKNFDTIMKRFGIEKIKTIGDAYMCAGGLPEEKKLHPKDLVAAALEMQKFLKKWNQQRKAKKLPLFRARIGIHTGPIVAGVVGQTKFAYDIWGDTVNVAARLETAGEVDRVNISQATYEHIKDYYQVEPRGKLPIKNLGEVEMYFIKNERS